MHRNIKLLYAFKAIKSFLLIMPVIIPFFQELGLNQTQIFILESAWAGSILIFEIPSGYFADKFGRKLSMIIGSFLATFANLLYIIADGFETLLIANILMGLSYSFISGADSALAFDSFAINKQELRYLNFESKNYSLSGIFQVIASLIGGALALINLKFPMIVQTCVVSISIPISFALTETPHLMKVAPASLQELIRIGKNTLFERKDLLFCILISTVIGNMTHTIIWITQPLYQSMDISLKYFGTLWAIQYLVFAIAARFSEKIERIFGETNSLIFFLITGCTIYFIIGLKPVLYILPLIFFFYAIRGAFKPIIANKINSLVESEHRATISSIESLIRKLFYALLGPVIGLVTDQFSVAYAFIFSGIIYGFAAIFLIIQLRTNQSNF